MSTIHVVIDEACHDSVEPSADYVSFIDRPVADAKAIVTRSFSKMHGLTGPRVGYAIAASDTARHLRSYQLPENLNVLAATAATIALKDEEHVRVSRVRNHDDQQEFFNQANARMLRVTRCTGELRDAQHRPSGDAGRRAPQEAQRPGPATISRFRQLRSSHAGNARRHASLLAGLGSHGGRPPDVHVRMRLPSSF
jgi:hypothetical protein